MQKSFLDPHRWVRYASVMVGGECAWGGGCAAEREGAGLSSGMSPNAGLLPGLVRLLRGHREDDEGEIGR